MIGNNYPNSINLLPYLPRRKGEGFTFKYVIYALIVLSIILLSTSLVAGHIRSSLNRQMITADDMLSRKKTELIEKEESIKTDDTPFITNLPSSFKLNPEGFYPFLNDFSQFYLSGAWLIDIQYDYSSNIISLKGYAKSPKAAYHLLQKLKSMPSLHDHTFRLFCMKTLSQQKNKSKFSISTYSYLERLMTSKDEAMDNDGKESTFYDTDYASLIDLDRMYQKGRQRAQPSAPYIFLIQSDTKKRDTKKRDTEKFNIFSLLQENSHQ